MLRRYSELKKSAGTEWPADVRRALERRDPVCVGRVLGFPVTCFGGLELDHIRASGGIGMKSRSTLDNGARLCSACHRWKTLNGRIARPLLLEYVERSENVHAHHVDPCSPGCHGPVDFEFGE